MKRVIILQIVLCAGIATAAIDPNLVGWWTFDEGSGTTAFDSSGDNDGQLVNGPIWVSGQINGALRFDGVNDYVEVPDNATLDISGEVTLAAWIKMNGYVYDWPRVIGKGGGTDYKSPYGLCMSENSQYLVAYIGDGIDWNVHIYKGLIISLGNWYHVAMTYSTINHTIKLYLDGEEVLSEPETASLINTTFPVSIGALKYPPEYGSRAWGNFFNGIIDDVRIYNRALSAEEIRQLYEGDLPELPDLEITGPDEVAENSTALYKAIAHYDDETTKDVTALAEWSVEPNKPASIEAGLLTTGKVLYPRQDVNVYAQFTENNTILDAEKTVSVLAICPQGAALEFDGSNDFVRIPNGPKNQITTNQISISAWIKLNDNIGNTQRRIICKQPINVYTRCWGLEIFGNGYGGSVGNQVAFHDSSGTAYYNCISPTNLIPGHWYHIGVSDNAGQIRLYINGSLNTSSDNGYGIPSMINAPVIIGSPVEPYFYFDGAIDEMAIFDRALSAEELRAIMHTKLTSGEPNLIAYWGFDEGEGQTAGDVSGNGNNGTLGSSSEPDVADPCWVESGAPVGQCTTEQVLVRNLVGATENKELANELIADAKAKERASTRLIDDLKKQLNGRELFEAMRAKCLIHIAIVQEEMASRQINMTIDRLEKALWLLSNETDPNERPGFGPWPSCFHNQPTLPYGPRR